MTTEIITQTIQECLIEFKDKLVQDTISYLVGLISESESYEEMKDQINSTLSDFEVVEEENERVRVSEQLAITLKRKGALSFSTSPKPKSYLVCELNPNAEPKITDPNLTMEDYIRLTRSTDPRVRVEALRIMCPCKVKADKEQLWSRIMEMAKDEDPRVRYQVLHDICDGSPNWREDTVIATLESMHNDTDPKVRKAVHNVLTHYRYTGKWNIL